MNKKNKDSLYLPQLTHLLGIEKLSPQDINFIIKKSQGWFEKNKNKPQKTDILRGKTQINLFFEPSTRTQSSFELAGKRLGADVINMSLKQSSVAKGETLIDTAVTLNAMKPDLLIVRHYSAGASELLSQKVDCSVINAGDGSHEHPTQAILDALTIIYHKKKIEGLKVAICGDILHSRVARSNIILLSMLGADINIVAPKTLLPNNIDAYKVKTYLDMREGIRDVDVIMMLRLQNERMLSSYIPSAREYFQYYGLDEDKLSYASKNAIVMHPGPMNRGVEIDTSVADNVQSVIKDQVEMGVAARMAVLETLATG
ncbi:MAG: aspartate carbamoyltransferase catalytic subunit [Pseudomonadota bacterium]|nr:aspartate carbamoyltransferase catalytic subunit [Pseudomonadota bacterium]MEC8403515.1 aspartate carbamoyltransferase catalytic subunit [Pseudomonadota bacterium]MEC8453253.1 aspartate carbamoyltransferase catalytic subunit [Pseudomonadota bacterium]MEC8496583.1 aspartate carbamoyltransferase catalytic subunit [Pseudomonadota bacterium]|tara:strand:- start:667 stop:1611 length:945 start_codon:yes stop_codon:yes gene_type:complete